MAQSSIDDVDINFMDVSTFSKQRHQEPKICDDYLASPWYKDVIYVLKNLQAPPEMSKTKAISTKLKYSRYYINNGYLYWKDPRGILLNCLLETEVKEKIDEFHKNDCGGHLFWKTTTYKILRVGFYWPTLFPNI